MGRVRLGSGCARRYDVEGDDALLSRNAHQGRSVDCGVELQIWHWTECRKGSPLLKEKIKSE